MFELRTLGGTDLRAGTQGSVAAVLSQPKRFALLCYLALGDARGGLVRRDTVCALFWPESDADRARNSLRQALFFLRRELGAACVLTRGAEEVGLAPGCVRSDAGAFREALAAGDRAQALACYGGDFLAGFNLSGLPEWEQWAAAERDRLRADAAGAAWGLADAAAADGRTVEAVDWARRAAGLTPGEEAPLRRLIQLLDRMGDRAAAVQAYDAFARQLAEGWELTPSRETRLLVADIRRRQVATPAASQSAAPEVELPARLFAPTTTDHAELPPAHPSTDPLGNAAERTPAAAVSTPAAVDVPRGRGWRRTTGRGFARGWKRPHVRALVAVALALGLVASGGVWQTRGRALSAAPAVGTRVERVAVFPFVVRGAGEWGYLSEGVADLLSARLDGAGALRSVDARALFAALPAPGGVQRPDVARDHAVRLGAGLYVLGSVVVTGERVQVRAGAYRMTGVQGLQGNGGGDVVDEVVVEGATTELPRLIDAVAVRLLADRMRAPGEQLERLAAMTTSSVPALKAFLDGERHVRAGDFAEAVRAFTQASTADTTFALALYRLSTMAERGPNPELVRGAIERALRYVDRLPAADALVLRGHEASVRGAVAEAEEYFRRAVALRPDDAEAWRQLGELQFHTGTWRGRAITRAGPAFARVLALRPDDLNARVHLARLAALEGRPAAIDSLATEADSVARAAAAGGAVAATEPALELRVLRAFATGDAGARRRALAEVRTTPADEAGYDRSAWLLAWRGAVFLDDPRAGLQLADLLTAAGASPRERLLGLTAGAHMEAARGRWRAARARLTAAAAIDPAYAAQVRANLATLPAAPLAPGELTQLTAALARTAGAAPDTVRDRLAAGRDAMRAVRVPYALGLLALRRGDLAGAAAQAAALDAAARQPGSHAELARHMAHQVRARFRLVGGDPAGALAESAAGWPAGTPDASLPTFQGETYAHAADRYLRAELLAARGRPAEALEWYDSVVEDLGGAVALHAPARLARARLLERLGRRAEAAAAYRRFALLWADADAELQPQVEAARRRAAALAGG